MDPLLDTFAKTLAGYGVLGIWVLYLIWQNWDKDKVIARRDERITELIDRASEREIETTKVLTELAVLVRSIGVKR